MCGHGSCWVPAFVCTCALLSGAWVSWLAQPFRAIWMIKSMLILLGGGRIGGWCWWNPRHGWLCQKPAVRVLWFSIWVFPVLVSSQLYSSYWRPKDLPKMMHGSFKVHVGPHAFQFMWCSLVTAHFSFLLWSQLVPETQDQHHVQQTLGTPRPESSIWNWFGNSRTI